MTDLFEFSPDFIFKINYMDGYDMKIATFGDERHVNLMGFYLEHMDKLLYVILYELSELRLDKPSIKREEKVYPTFGPYYYIEYNDFGEPLIVSDFKAFLYEDSLTFTFFDTPTDIEYKSGRFIFGFDDNSDPTFMTVLDITDDEYNNIIKSIQKRNIPISEKGRLKTENLLRPVKKRSWLPFSRRKK